LIHQTTATLIGFLGVSLLLLAFLLSLLKFMRSESYSYLILNLLGGALACYSSFLISFMPFVLLEGTWALVAAIALVRTVVGRASTSENLET
jgi:hypothetical protein